ncbi:hypothetical protein ACFVQB_28835 [Paenibacillus sp. NPDC057886]
METSVRSIQVSADGVNWSGVVHVKGNTAARIYEFEVRGLQP